MKIKVYLTALIILCLLTLEISGQNDSIDQKQYQLAFVPHYNLINGVRIDFEYKFKNANQYLQFAPRIYLDMSNFFGVGTGLFHKLALNTSNIKRAKPYFSYGAEYTNYIINSFRNEEYSVDSYRFSVMLGLQLDVSDFVFLDFYLGSGYSYITKGDRGDFFGDMYNPEYVGIYMPAGFRIGIKF